MSYESAVPVACMLPFGKVIGVAAPEIRSVRLSEHAARGDLHAGRITSVLHVKPKAAACCGPHDMGGMRVVDRRGDVSEDRLVARQSLQMFRGGYRGG